MKELDDYSGEFKQDAKLQDFSKDAVVQLFHTAARLYLGIDGVWNSVVRERFGKQVALDLEKEVWKRATSTEIGRVMRTMNIQGDDVATVFKVLQCDPGTLGVWDMDFELKNKNHGILTVKSCRPLQYFERHEDVEAQRYTCEVIEVQGMEETAAPINPRIKVTPLKLPPRKSKDESACQWEFKLEE